MQSVDEHELLQEFEELLHQVKNSAEMIITRDVRRIANITPVTEVVTESIRKQHDE